MLRPEMRTRIYIADVETLREEPRFAKGLTLISKERREKIGQLRTKEDRLRSLGAGLLLHQALTELDLDPQKAVIVYGENRKPRFRDISWLSFNLSHSGMRVMCAVGACELGCDVEQIRATDAARLEKIAGRFFTEREQAYLKRFSNPEERTDAFFRLWTLKESYLKFTGRGMALGLDTFSIDFRGDEPQLDKGSADVPDGCRFREYFREDGYHYSCCAENDRFESEMHIVDLPAILRKW
jgi:4'-phosphopantetheinyl transferase